MSDLDGRVIPAYSANHIFDTAVVKRLFVVRRWLALGVL